MKKSNKTTSAWLSISKAMDEVQRLEKIFEHALLKDAINKLEEAKELVNNYFDIINPPVPNPPKPPTK